ncbi:MAG: hypothetical protein QME94_01110, partial [Anaerolineae bacterium]|nr:hypothetical protein [Anaerolineae bacterium]
DTLAFCANVSLDEVNRVENQLPPVDPMASERIGRALGVSSELLTKISGLVEMSNDELNQLHQCLGQAAAEMSPECARIGML